MTLCTPKEVAVFSCQVGAKTLSLCANGVLTKTTGWMQYRFGRPGMAPELSFPEAKELAAKSFDVTTGNMMVDGAHWDFWSVRFATGGATYEVHWREGGAFNREFEGLGKVEVHTKDNRAVTLRCKQDTLSPAGFDALDALKPISTQTP